MRAIQKYEDLVFSEASRVSVYACVCRMAWKSWEGIFSTGHPFLL
jgi:hypothetical protein